MACSKEEASSATNRPAFKYAFGDRLTIVLHSPTNGDDAAIETLQAASARNPSNTFIALADPMAALRAPIRSDQTPIILTTFINKVALWGIYLKPASRRNSPQLRPLELLLKDFTDRRLSWFTQQYEGLRIACYEKAATNDTFVRAMFSAGTKRVQVDAFGVSEMTPVFDGKADLAFTTAPWVAQHIARKHYDRKIQNRVTVERFIPPLRYPYSAMVTTNSIVEALGDNEAKVAASPIGQFLRALQIAFALAQRAPHLVADYLADQKVHRNFASYGLATYGLDSLSAEEICHIANDALSEIVHMNCLPDLPFDAWNSWELAFLLTNRVKIQSPIGITIAHELFTESFRQWNRRTLKIGHPLYAFTRDHEFLGDQTRAT